MIPDTFEICKPFLVKKKQKTRDRLTKLLLGSVDILQRYHFN